MKKIVTSIAVCLSGFASMAQVDVVAPNLHPMILMELLTIYTTISQTARL